MSTAIRALACLIGTLGAFIVNRSFLLLIGLLFVMVVLSVQGRLRQFVRFSYVVLLPIAISLIFIWGFLLRAEHGYTVTNGVCAAIFAVARLALLGAMFLATQTSSVFFTSSDSLRNSWMKKYFACNGLPPPTSSVSFRSWKLQMKSFFSQASKRIWRSQRLLKETSTAGLTLSPQPWVHLFRLIGARGWNLAIVISCLNLWSDFREQLKQVHNGCCARGLVSSRHFWVKLRQLPTLVRTVFISLLIDSVERAKRWESNSLIAKLDHLYESESVSEDCSRSAAIVLLILSIAWTTSAAVCLF